MRTSLLWRAGISFLLFALVFAPVAMGAGKPSRPSGTTLSCTIDVLSKVVDEQDTSQYYNAEPGDYCDYSNSGSTSYTFLGNARFLGDLNPSGYQTTLYSGFVSSWTPVPVGTGTEDFGLVQASLYVNGDATNAITNPLRATIASSGSTLNLDLNGTSRTVTVDLSRPCDVFVEGWCPTPVGAQGGLVTTHGLLTVFLSSNESGATFTSMGICSSASRVCPEARVAYAKFWYTDSSGVNWRVDWDSLRVLRMSSNTWYVIADVCDGSDIAGLVKMNGRNTKGVLTGYYMIPLFITVVSQ